MKYIYNYEEEIIDFDRYHDYLVSIREKLPSHIYAFASDENHFNLTSHSSLHDSWLETFTVQEIDRTDVDPEDGEEYEVREIEIRICLLGPFHDRKIHLAYTGIKNYSFNAPRERNSHGDLLTHEIRLSENNLLIHEFLFASDATFIIECENIIHTEELIPETSV